MPEQKPNTALVQIETNAGIRQLPQVGAEIFDRERGQHIKVTEDGQRWMTDCHNGILMSVLETGTKMYLIRDRRLYLHWGFDTFKGYVEECLSGTFGVRQAHYFAHLGEVVQTALLPAAQSDDEREEMQRRLAPIGVMRWQELLRLPEDDLKKLALGEDYQAPDGRTYTMQQLTEMATGDLRQKLSGKSRDLSDAKTQIETLKSELDELRKIASGDSTVAIEATKKLEKLQAKYDMLAGFREQGERAATEMTKAKLQISQGIEILHKYIVRSEDDLESHPEECAMAAGFAAELLPRLERIADNYSQYRAAAQS